METELTSGWTFDTELIIYTWPSRDARVCCGVMVVALIGLSAAHIYDDDDDDDCYYYWCCM